MTISYNPSKTGNYECLYSYWHWWQWPSGISCCTEKYWQAFYGWPSKVKLSDSVRKRVSEGVQYIYNNTDSGQLASATNSIAKDLIDAIDSNDAIAIDINELKTSDEYTFKHSVDVATISMILAKQLGLSQKEIYEIGVAGLLHDIGKTKIPLEILNKPGKTGRFWICCHETAFRIRL